LVFFVLCFVDCQNLLLFCVLLIPFKTGCKLCVFCTGKSAKTPMPATISAETVSMLATRDYELANTTAPIWTCPPNLIVVLAPSYVQRGLMESHVEGLKDVALHTKSNLFPILMAVPSTDEDMEMPLSDWEAQMQAFHHLGETEVDELYCGWPIKGQHCAHTAVRLYDLGPDQDHGMWRKIPVKYMRYSCKEDQKTRQILLNICAVDNYISGQAKGDTWGVHMFRAREFVLEGCRANGIKPEDIPWKTKWMTKNFCAQVKQSLINSGWGVGKAGHMWLVVNQPPAIYDRVAKIYRGEVQVARFTPPTGGNHFIHMANVPEDMLIQGLDQVLAGTRKLQKFQHLCKNFKNVRAVRLAIIELLESCFTYADMDVSAASDSQLSVGGGGGGAGEGGGDDEAAASSSSSSASSSSSSSSSSSKEAKREEKVELRHTWEQTVTEFPCITDEFVDQFTATASKDPNMARNPTLKRVLFAVLQNSRDRSQSQLSKGKVTFFDTLFSFPINSLNTKQHTPFKNFSQNSIRKYCFLGLFCVFGLSCGNVEYQTILNIVSCLGFFFFWKRETRNNI